MVTVTSLNEWGASTSTPRDLGRQGTIASTSPSRSDVPALQKERTAHPDTHSRHVAVHLAPPHPLRLLATLATHTFYAVRAHWTTD